MALPLGKVILKLLQDSGVAVPTDMVAWVKYLGSIDNFFYGFFGFIATAAIGSLASLAFRAPGDSQLRGLTRSDMPPPYDLPSLSAGNPSAGG